MDVFLNYHSSSSAAITKTKSSSSNTFNGREGGKKKRNTKTMKLSTDPQSVAARERRHRISERFKILRSLIPGGDTRNTDTVSMLEEAVQYVNFLKSQILLHQTMLNFQYPPYHHLSTQLPHMEHEILPQLAGFAEAQDYKMDSHVIYP